MSRAVKAEVTILSVNNFQKFLQQDLECDSKILQHAHGVGGIEITFRVWVWKFVPEQGKARDVFNQQAQASPSCKTEKDST